MFKLVNFLMVGLGGALGSMLRYGVMLTVGVCGGFTTFSTFSLQNVSLLHEGKVGMAALYILSTVAVCVIMAWLGYKAGQPR